jgi:GDP-4-dehydro-6-deoxy-D-mannose reductase
MKEIKPVSNQVRALITGYDGFVGSYLSELLKNKNYDFFGTTQRGTETKNIFQVDVTNKTTLVAALKKSKPTHIFHLAGFSSVKNSFDYPDLCMRVNYGGTKNLLNSVREVCPAARVLIVGSAEAYGKPEFLPITEDHQLVGTSPYALSRIKQESLRQEFTDLHTFWTRSFNHTGPGQGLGFVVPDFASQIASIKLGQTKPVIRVGNLDAVRGFTDVRDVVTAYELILEKAREHEVYNVCSDVHISMREILDKLIEIAGIKVKVEIDEKLYRKTDVQESYGTAKKLSEDTGWEPRIKIEQTLNDTLDFWLKKLAK